MMILCQWSSVAFCSMGKSSMIWLSLIIISSSSWKFLIIIIQKYHYESLRIKKQHHIHPCSSISPHDLPQTARLISTIKTHPLFPMILPFLARWISILTIFHHQNPSIFPQRHIWSPGYPVLGFPSSSPPAIAARSRSWKRLPCAARSTRCSAPWGGETVLGPWGTWWFSTKWMEMLHQHAPTLFSPTKMQISPTEIGFEARTHYGA